MRTRALTWSDEIFHIYGREQGESGPTYEVFLSHVHPDDRGRINALVEHSLRTREPLNFHYRMIRPDGAERVIQSHGEVVCDERGEPVRLFGTAHDVTERTRAEEQLKSSNEKLRALSASLQSAREEEGTRIAREIHDELGSALSSLRWGLESFDKLISGAEDRRQLPALRANVEAMIKLTDSTIGAVRRIASELRPSVLDDLGPVEAIEWQAQQFEARTGIVCRCDCRPDDVGLSREQSTAVFRIFQEALTNILRHAQASRVEIGMREEGGEFVLTIGDDGRGITEEEKLGAHSLGLLGMRERAHLVGGEIEVAGAEGEGTTVTVRRPTGERSARSRHPDETGALAL